MNIKNMTPHEVVLKTKDGSEIRIKSEGSIRLSTMRDIVGTIPFDNKEIYMTKTRFGKAEGLPAKEKDTIFIVSSLVCQAYPQRDDFFIPDDCYRDEKGRIVGCKALSKNPFYKEEL